MNSQHGGNANPPTPPLLDQEKLVKILKDLQLDSMGVDLATPPEDNVEYLTDRLHRAEVQINTLAEEAMLELIGEDG